MENWLNTRSFVRFSSGDGRELWLRDDGDGDDYVDRNDQLYTVFKFFLFSGMMYLVGQSLHLNCFRIIFYYFAFLSYLAFLANDTTSA